MTLKSSFITSLSAATGLLLVLFVAVLVLSSSASATSKTTDSKTNKNTTSTKAPKKTEAKKSTKPKANTKAKTKKTKEATPKKTAPKKATTTKNHSKSMADVGNKTYDYVAQPGDSYTEMARKAVQTFGLHYHVNLSQAQIIYAETNLTQQANSPYLNVGQKVSIKQKNVQNWVEKAQDLSQAQLHAWQYYVQFVNFDTDAVGQPSK